MKINDYESNISIIKEIGIRIKKIRIAQAKTQEDVSKFSGVSLITIKNVENGKGCSLDTFIKILKALNMCSNFNELLTDYGVSVIDMVKLGKSRQRV